MAVLKRTGRVLALGLLPVVVALIALNAIQGVDRTASIYATRIEDRDVSNTPTEDYVVFYAAGKMVREGQGSELYDIDAVVAEEHEVMGRPVGGTGRLAYFNPPFVAALWAPLSALPVDEALVIWAILVGVLVMVSAVVGPRFLGFEGRKWALLSVALLVAEGTIVVVFQAQLTVFVVVGWVLFAGLMQRGRKRGAGACLAIALVKPHYVILPLLYLAWKRERAALTGFSVVAAPLVVLSVAVSGVASLWEYPLFLIESVGWEGMNGVAPEVMAGWHGVLYRGGTDELTPVTSLLTVAVAAYGVARARTEDLRPYAVLLMASLLISTHMNPQDTSLFIVATWFVAGLWTTVLAVFASTLHVDYQTYALAVFLALWSWRLRKSDTASENTLAEMALVNPSAISPPAGRAA